MAKKYKCPICDIRGTKETLISHYEDKHPECIPKGFTAGRVIFNYINKKTHGVCVVCKKPTEWNENSLKYNRLCGNKKCKEKLRAFYSKNMIRVHGTDNILNDVDQQEKMLKNRSISGKYKFSDGGYVVYTGSYEKNALEFLDTVLHYRSDELLCPGPVIEYDYKGKTHKYISDIYIIPLNLMIEVKDGGSNKNTRPMPEYRGKQEAKEDAIIKLGTYNYLRLTDNNFLQLVSIIMKLKMQMIDDSDEDKKVIIDINEEANVLNESMALASFGGMPVGASFVTQVSSPSEPSVDYVLSPDIISDKLLAVGKDGKLTVKEASILAGKKIRVFKVPSKSFHESVEAIVKSGELNSHSIYESISGHRLLSDDQIDCDPLFEEVDPKKINEQTVAYVQTFISNINEITKGESDGFPLMNPVEVLEASMLTANTNIEILESMNGYYAVNHDNGIRTICHKSISDIDISVIQGKEF